MSYMVYDDICISCKFTHTRTYLYVCIFLRKLVPTAKWNDTLLSQVCFRTNPSISACRMPLLLQVALRADNVKLKFWSADLASLRPVKSLQACARKGAERFIDMRHDFLMDNQWLVSKGYIIHYLSNAWVTMIHDVFNDRLGITINDTGNSNEELLVNPATPPAQHVNRLWFTFTGASLTWISH